MAHIRANTKNGKIVSYRFTVCLGRDCNGKQIRKYTTWPIPPDTSTAKAKKSAERAADIWEQELMSEYHKKLEAESAGKAYQIPAEKRHDDFVSFVNDVWFPLQIRDGKHKPKTIAFYESMTKLLLPCFSGSTLQGIGSLDIQRCLTYLRTEHKNQHGKPLTPKTLHHLYNTLNLIFGFAEKQELLVKNPMKLVDSPKKVKKPVDALTEEQAKKFFSLLPDRLILPQVLCPARAIDGIQQPCGKLLRQFADQAEHIAHIERSGIHKDLMIRHPDKGGKDFAKLCGYRCAQFQPYHSQMVALLEEFFHLSAKVFLVVLKFFIIKADICIAGHR